MSLSTNIPKLDELLSGGLPEQSSVLVSAEPGVRSVEFVQQLFHHRLSRGDRGIYVVNNKMPSVVREQFLECGWDLLEYSDKKSLLFVDCFSSLVRQPSQEEVVVEDPEELASIKKAISVASSRVGKGRVLLVFDSLSPLLDTLPGSEVSSLVREVSSLPDLTSVFLLTAWLYPQAALEELKKSFSCVIDLKAVERKVIVRNYFSVSKASWLKRLPGGEIPFKVLKPGGVHIYVPKILVTGPFNAGKTSFVRSASVKAVSVDRLGTTVALDHGRVVYNGMVADLFGTPGQERFDPIIQVLGGEALGVIIVLDSTAPETFSRAKDMIGITKTQNVPAVIVANKANLPGALSPAEIKEKMALKKDFPVVPVVAVDLKTVKKGKKEPCALRKEDVRKVLETLFEAVV